MFTNEVSVIFYSHSDVKNRKNRIKNIKMSMCYKFFLCYWGKKNLQSFIRKSSFTYKEASTPKSVNFPPTINNYLTEFLYSSYSLLTFTSYKYFYNKIFTNFKLFFFRYFVFRRKMAITENRDYFIWENVKIYSENDKFYWQYSKTSI